MSVVRVIENDNRFPCAFVEDKKDVVVTLGVMGEDLPNKDVVNANLAAIYSHNILEHLATVYPTEDVNNYRHLLVGLLVTGVMLPVELFHSHPNMYFDFNNMHEDDLSDINIPVREAAQSGLLVAQWGIARGWIDQDTVNHQPAQTLYRYLKTASEMLKYGDPNSSGFTVDDNGTISMSIDEKIM